MVRMFLFVLSITVVSCFNSPSFSIRYPSELEFKAKSLQCLNGFNLRLVKHESHRARTEVDFSARMSTETAELSRKEKNRLKKIQRQQEEKLKRDLEAKQNVVIESLLDEVSGMHTADFSLVQA